MLTRCADGHGHIGDAQLAWMESELRASAAAGEQVLLIMHQLLVPPLRADGTLPPNVDWRQDFVDNRLDVLRALFDKFDTDQNGKLDRDEFSKLLCQMMPTRVGDFGDDLRISEGEGAPSCVQFELQLKVDGGSLNLKLAKEFEAADTDGSGDIDFDEFVA